MCGGPEVQAVGGFNPPPPPPSCHQANKRELGVQIWLPSWLRKEEEEGWAAPWAVMSYSDLVCVTAM